MTPGLLLTLAALSVSATPDDGAGGYLQPTVAYHGLRVLGFGGEETQALQSEFAARVGAAHNIRVGATTTETAEQCLSDPFCHCKKAREARATHAIWGNVGRLDKLHTLELVLLDAQDCTTANTAYASAILEDGQLTPRMDDLLTRVLVPKEAVSQAAAKTERVQEEVPALVTVITAEQMRRLGVTRAEELFRMVPGFEALEMNWATHVLHNGMRGTVLFMLDGVPLSHALFNSLVLGSHIRFNIDALERVEFVRGPLSVLWGPYALLGVVNFVTRAPETEKLQAWAQARAGTLDTQQAMVALSRRTPEVSYSFSASFNRSRGQNVFVADSPYGSSDEGLVFGNSGFTENRPDVQFDLHGRIQLFRERLTLSVAHIQFTNPYEISPRGALLPKNSDAHFSPTIRVYSGAYEDDLSRGFRFRISAAQVEHVMNESFVRFPGSPDGSVPGTKFVQGNAVEPLVSRHAEARLHHDTDLGPARSAALLGFAYLGQTVPNVYTTALGIDDPLTVPNLDIRAQRLQTFAGFLQEDVTLFERITISGGLRYEHRAPFAAFLGKQAAVLARLPAQTSAKVIYSEGFRPPEVNDLFSTQGVQGNPALRPEKSRAVSLELGGEREGIQARLSGAVGELFDLIVLSPEGVSPGFDQLPRNRGRIGYVAAQAEVTAQVPHGNIHFAYGFKRLAESEKTGLGIPVAPHTGSLGVSVRPVNDVTAFINTFWLSPRRISLVTADGLTETTLPNTFGLDGGVRVSNIWNRMSFELLLKNPIGLAQRVPYRLDGVPNNLIERRVGSELLIGLRVAL